MMGNEILQSVRIVNFSIRNETIRLQVLVGKDVQSKSREYQLSGNLSVGSEKVVWYKLMTLMKILAAKMKCRRRSPGPECIQVSVIVLISFFFFNFYAFFLFYPIVTWFLLATFFSATVMRVRSLFFRISIVVWFSIWRFFGRLYFFDVPRVRSGCWRYVGIYRIVFSFWNLMIKR